MDYTLEALKSYSGLEFSYYPETGEITIDKGDVDKDQILLKSEEIKLAEPMKRLRAKRNELIAATDWRATVDYPGSDQAAWLTYRQALRDLPANSTPSLDDNDQLTGVTWPTPPE